MLKKKTLLTLLLLAGLTSAFAQSTSTPRKDTFSNFGMFNKKGEALFKILLVPMITYSSDAGNTFGLAKFNLFHPSKKDTISKPSKLAEVLTFSTKGRVNVSVSNDLSLMENKYMILSYFNYKKTLELILGIGTHV